MYSSVGLRAPKPAVFAASVIISVATMFRGAAQRLGVLHAACCRTSSYRSCIEESQIKDGLGLFFPCLDACRRHGGVVLLPRQVYV